MNELNRITTQYIEDEDRIRIIGDVGDHQTVTLWLTQRLLLRAVATICKFMEGSTASTDIASHFKQSFAQQTAKALLQPQAAVQVKNADKQWLITTVDINFHHANTTFIFKGLRTDHQVALTLNDCALRQWLAIIFEQTCKANWPVSVWPDWVAESSSQTRSDATVLH